MDYLEELDGGGGVDLDAHDPGSEVIDAFLAKATITKRALDENFEVVMGLAENGEPFLIVDYLGTQTLFWNRPDEPYAEDKA